MNKPKKYRKILKDVLKKQAKITIANMPNVKSKLFVDAAKENYILLDMGWHEDEFVHDIVYHFEIKKGKIYGYKNITDFDIVGKLVENGINKNDFVFTVLNEPEDVQNEQLEEAA